VNRAELRRRARWAVASLIEGDLDNGFEAGYDLTDNGTQEEYDQLVEAMRDIARRLVRTLPEGWEPPRSRPASPESEDDW
jgi:hypothetical protein